MIIAALLWHAISWHAQGVYETLFDMVSDGNTFLPVLYNLGLIVILASALGLLLGTFSDLKSYSKEQPSSKKKETQR